MTIDGRLILHPIGVINTPFASLEGGYQLGAFAGAWAGGFAFDRTGSFDAVWLGMIGMSVAAAIMHWLVEESPRPLALREAAA